MNKILKKKIKNQVNLILQIQRNYPVQVKEIKLIKKKFGKTLKKNKKCNQSYLQNVNNNKRKEKKESLMI